MFKAILSLVLVMCLSCASTATSIKKTSDESYTPSNSHFWCGGHCSVQAGCEEGLLCGCYRISTAGAGAVQLLMTKQEAITKMVANVREARAKYGFPALADETILRELHEIRQVHGAFNNDVWLCGVFYRYMQY